MKGVLFGWMTLLAACAFAAPGPALKLDAIPDVRIFRGDATVTYRDPAVWYEDGVFHLFFTYRRVEDGNRPYSYVAQSESRDLVHWTAPRILTPRGQELNYSSPGNVVADGEDRVLCFQTYPTPGATTNKIVYADRTARLFTMRTRDWKTWSAPELLRVKGDDVPREQMGRMIDPYLLRDRDDPGLWRCFYKQNGVSFSTSRDLVHWTFVGKADAGENVCVLLKDNRYVMFHSPKNGIGVKTSDNAVDWTDEGPLLTLGQKDWPWASGRITAGAVIDCRRVPGVGKYLMFFHASSPIDFAPASLGLAWSDDLKTWTWPGKPSAPGPLDELMPVPLRVEARGGSLAAADIGEPRLVTAPVKGAPDGAADEAYCLDVAPTGVVVTASGRRGAIWAKATLGQLAKLGGGRVPCCRIVDGPKFPWRGFMPDCGRNYIEVRHLKAMIDAMSANKMNLFHWHLTEYYGWRLESKRYPELQREGAFYLRHVGKYYTQDEFREIVDYAWARGVTVMPEFDVPGHALAFRRAFGFETMRDEGVRERLCDLVDELCSLVPAEKMPFVHLGTDEARLPEEKVPPRWLEPLVRRVQAAGRTVVGWTPGELRGLEDTGAIAGMRWGRRKVETLNLPCFDASGMYLDTLDPFELLGVATFRKVCPWSETEGTRLGGIVCAWHDDVAKDGYDFLRNQAVMPAYTLFGDVFWRGRDEASGGSGRWMPKAGDPLQARAAELERRVIAQRDKVWRDSPYPYHFLRQTDMRWRVTDARTGRLVARDIAQATVFLWQSCNDGVEDGRSATAVGNVFTNRSGVAVLETWIRSPVAQTVGAWIGFTDYVRNHGRAFSAPTPPRGKWNRTGATVEINGERVPPPAWRKPGQLAGGNVPHLLYVHELDEIPFEDEEYYMRPPTPIVLRKGWNHVKLTVPCVKAANYAPWVATFVPLLGTTEHPREVPGLEYACDPQ